MVSVYRVTVVSSGYQGAPGYSKFSFADLTDNTLRNSAGAKVAALFDGLKAYFHVAWTYQVQGTVDEFDMATGALIGSASMTTVPAQVAGTMVAANYAGGSGFCVTWNTGLVLNRRRVRGRTFFVPANGCFFTDGTLATAAITAIQGAANTFLALTAPRPNVWSRQWSDAKPPVQIGGALAPVDSYTLRDSASQLRTRRM